MTDEHKKAIAEGREQAKVVNSYLTALETDKPKRGRKVTSESLTKKLTDVEANISTASPVERLNLMQEKKDIEKALETLAAPKVDLPTLEDAFIKIAKLYAERRGIEKSTFVAAGVKPSVLKSAGI
jgi:hypothetical protein